MRVAHNEIENLLYAQKCAIVFGMYFSCQQQRDRFILQNQKTFSLLKFLKHSKICGFIWAKLYVLAPAKKKQMSILFVDQKISDVMKWTFSYFVLQPKHRIIIYEAAKIILHRTTVALRWLKSRSDCRPHTDIPVQQINSTSKHN